MNVAVGTFNLNNLFSRFNFRADLGTGKQVDVGATTEFRFGDPAGFRLRRYRGRLVNAKPAAESDLVSGRIAAMDLDVLAVQEVEDIDTLREFNTTHLSGRYAHVALVEGNDPRLIDVAVLSKLPIGGVTSWQFVPDPEPEKPDDLLFSRDLLQVEILRPDRRRPLFTLFNTHLKSHYVAFDVPDPAAEEARANALRARQAQGVADIVARQMRPQSRYVITGDMNDPPDSEWLAPLVESDLGLVNGIANPQETRPAPRDNPPPSTTAWTDRFKPTGKPAEYRLFDQVWLSPSLAPRQTAAWIDRRTRLSGDGSDHDPAWVVLRL